MAAPADLVREIEAGGFLTDPAWRAAFEEVPRELFVPFYYAPGPGGDYERLWRDDPDPERRARWRQGVYSDQPLATRIRDGRLLSSSSQPSLMARMLEYLAAGDGMDVLEIGTGPGYNAALLSHRLGDAHVTTVDLDPDITDAARGHLAAAGYRPRVVTGDGAQGCRAHAPYDRIIATCTVPQVPPAWLAQSAPGALILTPLATGLLSLRVDDEGAAVGRFRSTPAFFVPLRGTPGGGRCERQMFRGMPRDAQRSDEFHFLLALSEGQLDPADAYTMWKEAGRPTRERYGVSVRDGRQRAWLDDPEGPHTWPLPGTAEAGGGTVEGPGA
ncbi:methyltransferase domain-containing protein [Streptomyces sp. NBC_01186]|uniref:methyltransferase domain-containing protein n=1 Tax=unclassified Streptomyces TaxID=2593676 RepID=UPI002DD8811D|nr:MULTISPECIES: methyltransferase domain-containing protein [unclassified Streptomyces]WSB79149.1 methyltransferase domain-containing protein [Streptomyces sp. NBC_01775]WSS12649.1 methyltransferase domain-containing protein [Streptomyces sp. NBC_01186]